MDDGKQPVPAPAGPFMPKSERRKLGAEVVQTEEKPKKKSTKKGGKK